MPNAFHEDEGPQPPKVLRTPVEVAANLRTLVDQRTPLLIRFVDRSQRYQSFLVEINREKGWIAFDELIPNDGERLLLAGETFYIEGFSEGVRIAWSNDTQVHLGELQGARCYWAALPEEIIYHQRRNAFRAPVMGQPIEAGLKGKSLKVRLDGKLLDMSATGCKLSFKGDVQSRLQSGQVYDELSARLSFGMVTTAAELRHVIYDEKLDITFCGFRFYRISGLTQRNIERFVYQLQREARREQTSDRFE